MNIGLFTDKIAMKKITSRLLMGFCLSFLYQLFIKSALRKQIETNQQIKIRLVFVI